MAEAERSDEEESLDLFKEPDDYYQPEKDHTYVKYTTLNGQTLSLRLVGHNPLWGHHLWNGARTVSNYLERNAASLINDNTVLELGAGAGLPSLVCALNNAKYVVVTDYPDQDLIDNIEHNISTLPRYSEPYNIHAEGYLWGASTTKLIQHLPSPEQTAGFDILILADLLFNHSEHSKLISTVQQCLKRSPESQALLFFTPYRPWLLDKDLAFFDLAKEAGIRVDKILEEVMEKVMFEEDPGDEKLRRTVLGYSLRWADP